MSSYTNSNHLVAGQTKEPAQTIHVLMNYKKELLKLLLLSLLSVVSTEHIAVLLETSSSCKDLISPYNFSTLFSILTSRRFLSIIAASCSSSHQHHHPTNSVCLKQA